MLIYWFIEYSLTQTLYQCRNYESNTVCDSDRASLYVAYACNTCVAVEEGFSFTVNCDNPSMNTTFLYNITTIYSAIIYIIQLLT